MLTAVITLGAITVALIAVLVLTCRYCIAEMAARENAMSLERAVWTDERRELLNRIQRPEYVPIAPMEHYEIPELEPDDVLKVGTIDFLDGPDAE